MKVDLDKKALISLVCGQQPNYSMLENPIVKLCGSYNGSTDIWCWSEHNLEKFSDDELYKLYCECRKSWEDIFNKKSDILIEYFGTNLKEHGHYRWKIINDELQYNSLKFNDLPFHPEYLTNNLYKGEISFFQSDDYSVIAICGSPMDKRSGSKSVFWVKEKISKEDLIKIIKENKIAMSLIKAMSFKIIW